jgi:hypothetical protein
MRNILAGAFLGATLVTTLGCGSTKATFDQLATMNNRPSGGDGGGGDDATVPSATGDDGGLTLGPMRDAGTTATSVCTAGVYRGQFMTLVGQGTDGGTPGLFTVMWNGNLTIDLRAKTITIASGSGNGESFGTDTSLLEVAEGGALEGGDMYGGSFYANLNGELDCALPGSTLARRRLPPPLPRQLLPLDGRLRGRVDTVIVSTG